jgi:hypothetical protein
MGDDQREIERALDALIERFGGGDHQAELVRAREDWLDRTGRVFEDDALWEPRSVAFLEWYTLERPLDGREDAPVVVALRDTPADERAEAWRALASSHRSLFEVGVLEEGTVHLVDLLGGARFAVAERRRLHGVAEGDLVQARLIGWRGAVRFGRTFDFHPAGAREAILGHCHRLRGGGSTRADVIDYVASLRVRVERYRHVSPERVYEAATSEFPTRGMP